MAPRDREQQERPTTYGGVLTGTAATVVATLVALGAVLTLGWKAHDVVGRAEAAQPGVPAEVIRRLDKLDTDMLLIKCRLGIENICPPPQPTVNSISVGR